MTSIIIVSNKCDTIIILVAILIFTIALCNVHIDVLKPRNSLPNQVFDRDLKGGKETNNTD